MGCFRDRFLAEVSEMDQGGTSFGSSRGWSECCQHCVSPSVCAEVLLDTTGETSEIGWLTYPPGGVSPLFFLIPGPLHGP